MAGVLQISLHHLKSAKCPTKLTFNCHIGKLLETISSRQIYLTSTNYDNRYPVDPGTRRRARIFKDDEEFLSEVRDEEDFARLESDFQQADLSYKEHKRLVHKKKDHMSKMMTMKKFFKEPSGPNMLTWAERMQIRQLHESDPEEWTVDVLAESFPATREIIGKVLKAEWTPQNKEKLERADKLVKVNWELLAQDRLEGDPKHLAHLKKFLHRREEYLAAIGTEGIEKLLRNEEPKKKWNNGQMTSILESYERELERIDQKATKMLQSEQVNLLEDSQAKLPVSEKTDMEVVRERIKFEQELKMAGQGQDSFKIGGVTHGDSRQVTLDELKDTLAGKSGQASNPLERVIAATARINAEKANRPHINNRLAALAGYVIPPYKAPSVSWGAGEGDTAIEEASSRRSQDRLVGEENESKRKASSKGAEYDSGRTDETFSRQGPGSSDSYDGITNSELKRQRPSLYQSYDEFMGDGEGQKSFTERSQSGKEEEIVVVKTALDCSTERERGEFQKEESSIEGTFFWPQESDNALGPNNSNPEPSENPKDMSALSESPVSSLSSDSEPTGKIIADFRTSTQPLTKKVEDAPSPMDYPERIKIPKDKRVQGMTYRVNDCFYDADGQFLYRVPGMTKTSA